MSKSYVPLWSITPIEPPYSGKLIRAASATQAWKTFVLEVWGPDCGPGYMHPDDRPCKTKPCRDDFTVKQVDESIYHRPVRQTSLFSDPLPLFETDF